MRSSEDRLSGLFSYLRLEDRIAADHPLRAIRALADEALAALSGRFTGLYARTGRPSIPPEQLLRAALLQAFFSVRSERQLGTSIYRWPNVGCADSLPPDKGSGIWTPRRTGRFWLDRAAAVITGAMERADRLFSA